MPINKEDYPDDWEAISWEIRNVRAENRCECEGECGLHDGRCTAVNYKPHPVTGSKVILTVAHLDQDSTHGDPTRLKAMCQRCHLTYDRNYYRDQRLSWIKTLSDIDLKTILTAMEFWYTESINSDWGRNARMAYGDDIVDAASKLLDKLQEEFDKRNNDYDLGS